MVVSVYIAQSLDGYIAREDGNLDWLDAYNCSIPQCEDLGFHTFMASVDILVMGRNTYEKVRSFGVWPYEKKQVIVLSSQALEIPKSLEETVSHSSDTAQNIYKRLEDSGIQKVYLDGANTIQRFLRAGLVDEFIITIIPTLLGSGISLFGSVENDVQLELVSTQGYEFGVCQLNYKVKRKVL
jgi:dihydrofolate reductase